MEFYVANNRRWKKSEAVIRRCARGGGYRPVSPIGLVTEKINKSDYKILVIFAVWWHNYRNLLV